MSSRSNNNKKPFRFRFPPSRLAAPFPRQHYSTGTPQADLLPLFSSLCRVRTLHTYTELPSQFYAIQSRCWLQIRNSILEVNFRINSSQCNTMVLALQRPFCIVLCAHIQEGKQSALPCSPSEQRTQQATCDGSIAGSQWFSFAGLKKLSSF